MEENRNQGADMGNMGLFPSLIMMLGSSAMQQLGKMVNPMTGKTEVSLEGAQASIDMLEMLKEKTQGNLKAEEEKMLSDLLSTLQMNYVQTAQEHAKQPSAAPSATPPPSEKTDAPESEPEKKDDTARPQPESAGSYEEKREPKFHKSYGA